MTKPSHVTLSEAAQQRAAFVAAVRILDRAEILLRSRVLAAAAVLSGASRWDTNGAASHVDRSRRDYERERDGLARVIAKRAELLRALGVPFDRPRNSNMATESWHHHSATCSASIERRPDGALLVLIAPAASPAGELPANGAEFTLQAADAMALATGLAGQCAGWSRPG